MSVRKDGERPNILFLFTDQMRWDCMSILGHPVVETPHLDALGRSGVVFTSAFSPAPSCIAARASVFTGLAPKSHGRLGYRDRVPWRYEGMLAGVLARAGYQTHGVGKTHFCPQGARFGFESMDSYEAAQNLDGRYVNDYWRWLAEKTGGRQRETDHGLDWNSWMAAPSTLPEELHNNAWVATKSIEFLGRRDRSRPFFLFASFHRPHAPLDPPQPYYDMYTDRDVPPAPVGGWAARHDVPVDDPNAWQGRLAPDLLARARRAYCAQIAHIDAQIGRILRELDRLDAGPTVILFTSDHGEMLGDHHLFRKTFAYQGSAAVPMILSMPGEPGHGFCDAPVTLEDCYPTLLEAAGVPVPGRIDGRSFAHLARDPRDGRRRDYVHGEHSPCYAGGHGVQFVTDGREKFIWYTLSGEEQFFDLARDPYELRNLAADPAAKARVEFWRKRLVAELASRPEDGLSDGTRLIAGKSLPAVRPELLTDNAPQPER